MRVGITGHQDLAGNGPAVVAAWDEFLNARDVDAIVSSLAGGADQLLARRAVAAGLALVAVIPCGDYEETFTPDARSQYLELLAAADAVTELPYPVPSSESYLAAGLVTVERSDVLIAVWDGEVARGLGGTADVVAYAESLGREVVNLWPAGASR